jgi:opacity protein-like surface antigen
MKKWIVLLLLLLGFSSLASAQNYSVGVGFELYLPVSTPNSCGGSITTSLGGLHVVFNVGDLVRLDAFGLDSRVGFAGGTGGTSETNPCPCSGWFCGIKFPMLYLNFEADVLLTYDLEGLTIYAGPGISYYLFNANNFFINAVAGVRFPIEYVAIYVEGQLLIHPSRVFGKFLFGILFNV